MQHPMPEVDQSRQPPFTIHLAPWAVTTAEDLHSQFGDTVDLTVGALPYPPGRQRHYLPGTGQTAGGFAGAQGMPLIITRIAPGQAERIPLLVGTASFSPRLGYAVPAGERGIRATLTVGPDPTSSPRRRTPVMPLTITS